MMMSNAQAFGTARNTFYAGNDIMLLKHVCPPEFFGGPLDPITPNRRFRLSLMKHFGLHLPANVAQLAGTDHLPMWIIENDDADPKRAFPSALLRMVQGEVVHAQVESASDTHTIHWHGIEPTTMNDGVGKHSFEIHGTFVYQFQPNEAGTYFYHCHKNTPLHFEMGLYGGLIVDPPAPPDSGLTAPYNTGGPGFVAGRRPGENESTIRYDLEKLWVVDDMDASWHFPEPDDKHGMQRCDPVDPMARSNFYRFGSSSLNLNVFHQNIFTVSGVVMDVGSGPPYVGMIDDPAIRIDASVGQTVLVRYINASYSIQELTLPVDATVIAWDGHPLGVGGFHRFSTAYVVRAGTPIRTTSARRYDIILQPSAPVTGLAQIRTYQWIKGVPAGFVGQTDIPVNIL
jgi:FtsP/CotA-like multicopper oxidase with cupredoxin domain